MTDRELDALIAEKVMGMARCSQFMCLPEDNCRCPIHGIDVEWPERGKQWSPSTSIADAWEVVERMRELSFVLTLSWQSRNSEWCAHWFYPADRTHKAAFHKSAPRAICLAALKTIGVDVDLNTSKKQSNA